MITQSRTAKWGLSKWCKTNQHGWCYNRNAVECHCSCKCHKKRSRLERRLAKLEKEKSTLLKRIEELEDKLDNHRSWSC